MNNASGLERASLSPSQLVVFVHKLVFNHAAAMFSSCITEANRKLRDKLQERYCLFVHFFVDRRSCTPDKYRLNHLKNWQVSVENNQIKH